MAAFDYDTIPVGFYDGVYRQQRGVQSKWHHLKFDRFVSRVRTGERLLDVGCGPGTFIGMLPREVDATGVDIAEAQIAYATRHYEGPTHRFRQVAEGSLPFEAGAFDVATSIELVEHVTPDYAIGLLRDIHRVLRPGGRLLVSTPNYGSLWPLLELVVNQAGAVSYADQHINKYTSSRLRDALLEAGFGQVEVEAYQFAAPFAAALNWRAPEVVGRLEPAWLTRKAGFLLFAEARKAAP